MGKIVWRFFIFALLAAAGFILAFGPRPVSSAPAGRTHLKFWASWAGREAKQTSDIVDIFNATVGREKNIWVDFDAMSDMDSKFLVSTAGGIPPDVALTWDAQLLSYANMGALEELGPYTRTLPNLARDQFKPVFYDGCTLNGKLYAIPYTVWAIAMVWNKAIFQEKAAELRKAGLDPDRAPRTIDELDRYAQAIDTWDADHKHMTLSGFIPSQPGPFNEEYGFSFGAPYVDSTGTKLLLTDPRMIATYDWIRGFSQRMGKDALVEFNSGLGQFDSPSNPFMAGQDAMEQMGPWIGAFIEKLKPEMNRWHVPADQLQREQDFQLIPAPDPDPEHQDKAGDGSADGINPRKPMTRAEVEKLLGPGDPPAAGSDPPLVPAGAEMLRWLAGIKDIYVTFVDDKAVSKTWTYRPAEERKKYSQWGAVPFPSGVPGVDNIAYAGMDVLVIPSTSRHKTEAAEFLNFMLRQDMMERLAMGHSNQSPLVRESDKYLYEHPNAYIDVWDKVSDSPNSRPLPRVVTWAQLYDELNVIMEQSVLLEKTSKELLTELQRRAQAELNDALNVPPDRNLDADEK